MFGFGPATRIYVAAGATDMRKNFNGLYGLVRDRLAAAHGVAAEAIEIVESGLRAHGEGQVVLPPKSHLNLDDRFNGHFNILAGYADPAKMAGIKVIGDYVDNYRRGLPSEVALLTLYDPETGVPRALLDRSR